MNSTAIRCEQNQELSPVVARWVRAQALRVGSRLGKTADEADDFAGEAAYKAALLLRERPDLDRKYLVSAMWRHVLSVMRKQKVRSCVTETSTFEDEGRVVDATAIDPFEAAVQTERYEAVRALLDGLDPEDQQLLVASVTVGISAYAASVGIKPRRAASMLSEARSRAAALGFYEEM